MKNTADTCHILGVSLATHTGASMWERIENILSERKNARIFTPNAEMIYKASRSREYTKLLNSADLCLPDGAGVRLASWLTSAPLSERLTGIDTAEQILRYAAEHGLSVYLLGGKPRIAELAKKRLEEKISGLNICGTHHGYFDPYGKENKEILDELQGLRPDILFVCLGFPRQEEWIAKNTPSLPFLRLSMGLGGSLDVWSGEVKRAPDVFQKLGLEWLWRTLHSPSRLFRLPYLAAFFVKSTACSVKPAINQVKKLFPDF